MCSLYLDGDVVLVVFDIETTGHGLETADIIQIAASAVAFPRSCEAMHFNAFCGTPQSLNWVMNNKEGFAELFTPDLLRTSPPLEAAITDLLTWIAQAKTHFNLDRVWLAGHKIFSSDLVAVSWQSERIGLDIKQRLLDVGV